jgi:hypothetical protein
VDGFLGGEDKFGGQYFQRSSSGTEWIVFRLYRRLWQRRRKSHRNFLAAL